MNIHEFSERYKISLAKSRRILKENPHWFDGSASTQGIEIRSWLANGQPLTSMQLCTLIENPGFILELGKHAHKAEEALARLGNVKAEIARLDVAACITDAASKDPESLAIIINWLKTIIPSEPVGHAYLATRLLLGLPENVRQFDAPRLQRVFLNCRLHPSFENWFFIKKNFSKSITFYKKPFDL